MLLYAGHNTANAIAAYPAGAVADRIGRRPVLIAGVTLFSVACIAFAFSPTQLWILAVLFVAVGTSTGLVGTGQAAHAAELLDPEVRGRGFGLLGLVDGIGDFASSLIVGLIFTFTAPAAAFIYAAVMAGAGALALAIDGSNTTTTCRRP